MAAAGTDANAAANGTAAGADANAAVETAEQARAAVEAAVMEPVTNDEETLP